MAARRLLLPLTIFVAAVTLLALPRSLRSQDVGAGPNAGPRTADAPAAAPDVPTAPFNFIGEVTGSSVYVRSGPSDSYYPTAKLSKGTRITVRGAKFNYLKIEPPPGSFSYVGKAYVERRADGNVGRVTTAANVRTGSELNPMKTTVQTKLEPGTDVKIQGEQEEYYKIDPPAGAYLYVQKDFVAPVERIRSEGEQVAGNTPTAGRNGKPQAQEAPPVADSSGATGAIADAATRGQGEPRANDGASGAPLSQALVGTTRAPDAPLGDQQGTTRPADSQSASADARFEKLEADFEAANQRPVIDQPVGELLAGYQSLQQDESLAESLKRIADARIAALKVRQQTRDEFAAVRKSQQEMDTRRKALQAEQQEIEEQIQRTNVEFFAAVGTLRPSSLQQGPRGTVLYRLTDSDTGRTLVYIRTADREYGAMVNQFVGVKGELKNDPLLRLKVITPSETKVVDASKLGSAIAAAVMPASQLRNTTTVSTEATPVAGQ